MSKKKNKKSKKSKSYYDYAYGGSKKLSKKEKKAAKKNKSYYEKPKFKTVKPSLDKKEVKENRKILVAPVEIPKVFTKNRTRCNHAGDLISVEKFKSLTPTYAAFTPMLDPMIEVFGEKSVQVCKSCYDVVVDPAEMTVDGVKQCIAILYAAANVVLSHDKMKDDEIKNINKVKEDLGEWNEIIEKLEKLVESGALDTASSSDDEALSSEDLAKLNKIDGSNPVVF